jgi:O-antigen chain-terminating methyltransferase
MKNDFYEAFTKKFKETGESLKEKQEIYLHFITPVSDYYSGGIVLNIGPNRKEWLELMKKNNMQLQHVPFSLSIQTEGMAQLQAMESESVIAVTIFHLVEYIDFDLLHALVHEADRILKPGGLLILETPNPENIRVASEQFYLDPARTKPIPPKLLSFVTEYHGFERNKIIRLQENTMLAAQKYTDIAQVLGGVSSDYAIIAQKKSDAVLHKLLDIPFSKQYGLSLSDLIEKFERRMLRFEELTGKAMQKVQKAEEFAWKAEVQASKAEIQTAEAAEYLYQTAESVKIASKSAENAWKHYQALVHSPSWKITKPLRMLIHIMRSMLSFFKRTVKFVLRTLGRTIHKYPKLKTKLMRILDHFPKLKQKLIYFSTNTNSLYPNDGKIKISAPNAFVPEEEEVVSDLKRAFEKEGKI